MKKSKIKSLVRSARKTVAKDIKLSLITELKEVTGKLGQVSKKLNKEIEKGSKQLAKKLSKELKIDKSAILTSNGTSSRAPEKSKRTTTRKKTMSSGAAALAPGKPSSKQASSKSVKAKSPVFKSATGKVNLVKKVAVVPEPKRNGTVA